MDIGPVLLGLLLSDGDPANQMLTYNIELMGLGSVLHIICNLHMDMTAMEKAVPLRQGVVGRFCQFLNSLGMLGGAIRVRACLAKLIFTRCDPKISEGSAPDHEKQDAESCRKLGWPGRTCKDCKPCKVMEECVL